MTKRHGYLLFSFAVAGVIFASGCAGTPSGSSEQIPNTLPNIVVSSSGTNPLPSTLTVLTPEPSQTSSETPPPPSSPPPGISEEPLITVTGQIVVSVTNSGFSPDLIYAPVGTIVVWQNSEPFFQGCCPRCHVNHAVVSDDGILNGLLSIRDVYAHYFHLPGTYSYYDNRHPELKGTVVIEAGRSAIEPVRAPAGGTPPSSPPSLPGTGSLVGQVQLPVAVKPSEVSVWLFPANNRNIAACSASLSAGGEYYLGNVPPGAYIMYVTKMEGNTPLYFMPSKSYFQITAGTVTTADTFALAG